MMEHWGGVLRAPSDREEDGLQVLDICPATTLPPASIWLWISRCPASFKADFLSALPNWFSSKYGRGRWRWRQ